MHVDVDMDMHMEAHTQTPHGWSQLGLSVASSPSSISRQTAAILYRVWSSPWALRQQTVNVSTGKRDTV